MAINVLDVVSLILIAPAIDPESFFSASIAPVATDPPNMRCGGCMLRIDREIWFYEGEPGVRSPSSIRTVADRNSNRTSYQPGAYSNSQTEVRARTPRMMAAESRCSPSQTLKSAYAYANKSGFVDWGGERVRCPNLQQAHGGYLQWFPRILARHRGTLIPSPADRYTRGLRGDLEPPISPRYFGSSDIYF